MSRDFQLTCNTASGHVVSSIVAVVRSDLALSIDRSGGNTVPVPEIRAGEVELALPESSRPRCWSSFPSPLYTRYTVHLSVHYPALQHPSTAVHSVQPTPHCRATISSRKHLPRCVETSVLPMWIRVQVCGCGAGKYSPMDVTVVGFSGDDLAPLRYHRSLAQSHTMEATSHTSKMLLRGLRWLP
jgi:hypothetical protein